MRFNIGDKVRFLNAKGGGVISKILNGNMVSVAIEDGFEIPTLASELIIIEPVKKTTDNFPVKEIEQPVEKNSNKLGRYSSQMVLAPGVYLAFVPHEQRWLITGLLDVLLINYTHYTVLYNIFLKNIGGSFEGIDYGSVEAQNKLLLSVIKHEEVEKWCQGVVQLMFHIENGNSIKVPSSTPYSIKPVKFLKEDNYKFSSFIEEKSFIIQLVALESLLVFPEKNSKETSMEQTEVQLVKEPALISKHRTAFKKAEVDLHIAELVENISGMNSKDMLTTQINYFSRCLESAIKEKYREVIFIHGKGNGVLKATICSILNEYENIQYRDASLANYGQGAVEVIIPQND
ncbi:MAG: DUF2027 domain-containing protein [Lentimicrobiaceae bacterium]|nr:DUF2027 domain-containing protein [Lentimicrobiaceae bacterium]